MKTIILYNIISLMIICVLMIILRIVRKGSWSKNNQRIMKVIAVILTICVIASALFLDAIAFRIIGFVPN